MDEEERTRHLRRLRKRGVDSNFPAPPPLDFSRRCNGACPSRPRRKAVPIVPGDPGRGRMHVFPRLPPWRIAGCLEGAELEAARAEWHALDKTDEREAMRRARNLAMSRSAPRREGDSARRAKARREKRDRERACSKNIYNLAPRSVPPPRPTGRLLGFVRDTSREIQPPLSRLSPPPGRESKPRPSSFSSRAALLFDLHISR